ncbi:hypothetical protein DKX38_001406 [Salix brachista]|uniref:Uncharacterized protein n=1 Tax=Salix brachista TaxID=2182728 RepID=A0A5N5P3L9_9ROSI|nr:hypothetical protein DKX38_001406 [Salix brachista]
MIYFFCRLLSLQILMISKISFSLFKRLPESSYQRYFVWIMLVYIDIADETQAKPFLTLLGIEDSKNTVAFDDALQQLVSWRSSILFWRKIP